MLKKKFYLHLGLSVIMTFILLLLVLQFLKAYTRHGVSYVLPDYKGKTLDSIAEEKSADLFEFMVTDSIYISDVSPGAIIKQNPSPGSKVKQGRKIYVTIVARLPEKTIMPDLKDLTLRQAVTSLKMSGLETGMLHFEPGKADNAVLGQFYNHDSIAQGTELEKGSVIDLVVGAGLNRKTNVPFLVGMRLDEAIDRIHMSAFNLGKVYFLDEAEPVRFRVYRQSPTWEDQQYYGDPISLWLRSELAFNFDSLVIRVNPDSAAVDTIRYEELDESIFEE